MRLIALALLLLAASARAQTVAIVDVSTVPLDSARTVANQTIVMVDGTITAIGLAENVTVPEGAEVIDGRRLYAMPGLADMHAHLAHPETEFYAEDNRASLALMLAHGVTTARVMWGTPGTLAFVDSVRSGAILGPDLTLASPFVQGRQDTLDTPWTPGAAFNSPGIFRARTEADARAIARHIHAQGYDYIKAYDYVPPAAYRALLDEAESLGLAVVGHVPFGVPLAEVITDGRQSSIEHARAFAPLAEALDSPSRDSTQWYHQFFGRYAHISPDRLAVLAEMMRASRQWIVPTVLTAEWNSGPQPDMLARISAPDMVRFTPAAQRQIWLDYANGFALNYERWGLDMAPIRAYALSLVRAMHEGGARLLLGTDATPAMTPQGVAVHEEMALWAEAGLPPVDILRAASLSAHTYLTESGLADGPGGLAVGARADLVLLRADPLADLANAREIEAVITRGRVLDRSQLDAMLAEVVALYAGDAP